MSNIYADNSLSIGRTPLVKINRITQGAKATVLAKVEGRNPSYSVKCRIGAAMIWDAEKRGVLKPGMEIVEATSGNTGIALSYVAAARGYKVTIVMPETMSIERRRVVAAFGATVILTPAAGGTKAAVVKAAEIVASDAAKYFGPDQFKNPANPKIHETTTGAEIWADTDGKVDILVSGVGTGGTITGVSRYFENVKGQKLHSVAVEPSESPVITQRRAGQELKPGPHKIQGLGTGFIPDTLDLSIVDAVEQVSSEEAYEYARRLAAEEGLLSGISSGAAIIAADRLARREENAGKTIVAILPDAGERYLSTPLFQGLDA